MSLLLFGGAISCVEAREVIKLGKGEGISTGS